MKIGKNKRIKQVVKKAEENDFKSNKLNKYVLRI
jgi:hypothetical protein